jgi:hypothetical protein
MTRGRGRDGRGGGGRVSDSKQGAGDAVGNMNAQVASSAEDAVDDGAKKSIMDSIATKQLKMDSTSMVIIV